MGPLEQINLSAKRCRDLALDARLIDEGEAIEYVWREIER